MLPTSPALLGGTGSIGDSTLDVIAQHPERFRLRSISGYRNIAKLIEICKRFRPDRVVVANEQSAKLIRDALAGADFTGINCGERAEILWGADGLDAIAADAVVDVVVAAIVGAAGLSSALAAARAGKIIALANKEALVMSGSLLSELCLRHGARLLPIDSEHNAVFQCLPFAAAARQGQEGLASLASSDRFGVESITLTASGGPFRTWTYEQMKRATVREAVKHPNWSMGQKISVDSASLMNKGLELIEAQRLFNVSPDKLQVLIHPQSIVHAMVQYRDGSVIAQLGAPDMRTPIAIARLDFELPDLERFPALGLAIDAMRTGGNAPCVLNAANEVAVAGFLANRCRFTDIAACVAVVLHKMANSAAPDSLEAVLQTDAQARSLADEAMASLRSRYA
ncbi:MAG: 1-deoxy-D-xylulose-5-phosphate reductoisomerase [Betaproteobacteria bacterium]|nr:1-deoxy-D-xylulose-5-phosphate reductoisomerase [Betaproteobacteria bacterium]